MSGTACAPTIGQVRTIATEVFNQLHVSSSFTFTPDGNGGFSLSHNDGQGNIVAGVVTHNPSTFAFVDNGDGTTTVTHTDGNGVETSGILSGPVAPDTLTAVTNPDGSITVTHTPINAGAPTSFTIPAPAATTNPSQFTFAVNPDGSITLTHDDGNGNVTTGNIPAETDSDASVAAGGEATTHQGAAAAGDIIITLDNGDVVRIPQGTGDTDTTTALAVGGEATTFQGTAEAGDVLIQHDGGNVTRIPAKPTVRDSAGGDCQRRIRLYDADGACPTQSLVPLKDIVGVRPAVFNAGLTIDVQTPAIAGGDPVPVGQADESIIVGYNFADGSLNFTNAGGGPVPTIDLNCHNAVKVAMSVGSSITGGWADGTIAWGAATMFALTNGARNGYAAGGAGTGGPNPGQGAPAGNVVADNDQNNAQRVHTLPLQADGSLDIEYLFSYFGGGVTSPAMFAVLQVLGYECVEIIDTGI